MSLTPDRLVMFGGGTGGERRADPSLSTRTGMRHDFDTDAFVCFNPQAGGKQTRLGMSAERTGTIGACQVPAVAFPAKSSHANPGAVSQTLRDGPGGQVAVCVGGEIAHTLASAGADASEDGTGRGTPVVATAPLYYSHDFNQDRVCGADGPTPALTAADSNRTRNHMIGSEVRRLTPVECERLQGWPDDWTRYDDRGRGVSDGPRYRMIGNGVAAPVAEWIGRRLVAAVSGAGGPHPAGTLTEDS